MNKGNEKMVEEILDGLSGFEPAPLDQLPYGYVKMTSKEFFSDIYAEHEDENQQVSLSEKVFSIVERYDDLENVKVTVIFERNGNEFERVSI